MLDPGQPKGSQNPLSHGIYSSEILLLGEKEEDFIALLTSFKANSIQELHLKRKLFLTLPVCTG